MEEKMEMSAIEETSEFGTSGDDKDDIGQSGDDIGSSGDEDNGPTRAALHNPIILQKIFSNLGLRDVKVVREVCKAWENEGSIILGKLCRLPLHHLFDNYKRYQDQPLPVNPKLLQSVYIRSLFLILLYRNDGMIPDNVSSLCFNSFASMWHDVVEELHVDLDYYLETRLQSTLNAYSFPNLTKMTITKCYSGWTKSNSNLQVRCMNTLKELKINDYDCLESDGYLLLRNLITSAPNLEVLEIYGHFYPSLAACRNLKVLKWIGQNECRVVNQVWEWEEISIEPDEVVRMINEVGNSLEHLLTIGLSLPLTKDDSPVNKLNERFPRLPKLKSLTLGGIDILNAEDRISPSILPNLQMLSYHVNKVVDDASRVEQGCYLTHMGVKSLELSLVGGPDAITNASKRFPNVKRLVIRIEDPKGTEGFAGIPYLGAVLLSVLEASSIWKLICLEVQIGKKCNLSQLLEELQFLGLLDDGIKQVRITLNILSDNPPYLVDDDQDYDLQALKDVLQLGAKFDGMIFKGFAVALKPTTMEKGVHFLNDHKGLPVFFVD